MSKPYALDDDSNLPATTSDRPKHFMEEIAQWMPSDHFAILLALINWGVTWQDLHEGNTSMDNDKMHAMKMVFNGVGPNPQAWVMVAANVIPLIGRELIQWEGDKAYRTAKTMPWCILEACGPELARHGNDWESAIEVTKILSANFVSGERPDVPSVSEVSRKVAERASAKASIARSNHATGRPIK